ncbi:E3 ubiquitin-protein ligase DTX3 [Biomphalaria pfeifferi]|uniref:RING-type E3 ubiquitin transferase n=1 Tax=Biomphalaria pfeifferi TaxID=112525 RepID=A0AAD8CCA1_BIOPF|nr:E3 ubiquitin-protein ligase DTX3 [Biomphalaria pfeifferi]
MSQNLFKICQLTINKDISNSRNSNLEEEITQLGFKILCFTPLKIEITELTEDIFKKLTQTLKKYSQSHNYTEQLELINSNFKNLTIKDVADHVCNDTVVHLNISDASKEKDSETCKNELKITKLDSSKDSLNRSIITENIEVNAYKPNYHTQKQENADNELETAFEEKEEATADSSPIIKEDMKLDSLAVSSIDVRDIDVKGEKCVSRFAETRLTNKKESLEMNKVELSNPIEGENSEDIQLEKGGNFNDEKKNLTLYSEHSETSSLNESIQLESVTSSESESFCTIEQPASGEDNDINSNEKTIESTPLKKTSEVIKEETIIRKDVQKVNEKKVALPNSKEESQLLDRNLEILNPAGLMKITSAINTGDKIIVDNYEKTEDIDHKQQCTSCTHSTEQIKISKNYYEVLKYYFNDHALQECIDNAKAMDNKYVIQVDKDVQISEETLDILRNFKSVLFDDVSANNAHKWKKLLEESYQEIKVLYDENTANFQIMGPRINLLPARALILKLRGNKDTDMIYTNKNKHTDMMYANRSKEEQQTLSLNSNKDKRKDCSSDLGLLKTDKDTELRGAKFSNSSFERENEKHFASPVLPQYQESSTSHKAFGFEMYKEIRSRNIKKDQKRNIFVGKSDLKVRIFKTDITKLNVDMIVNAANTKLKHNGGVALAISKEAGHELVKDCEEFIKKNGSLRVTDVFVSKGGRLKAKYVMHAVGPMWDCYEDKRNCLKDLRQTVLRCLIEASLRNMKTVSLPSISAAIFKVPAKQCAENYMAAVKSFDCIRQKLSLSTLEEVWFVDVNEDLVHTIQDEFNNHWEKDDNENFLQEDLHFVYQHLDKSEGKSKYTSQDFAGKEKKHSSSTLSASGSKPKESKGLDSTRGRTKQKQKTYEFKHLKIMISVEPALRFSDEIVIVFGDPFDELSGLQNFESKKCFQSHNGSDMFIPKGFKLFASHMNGKTSKNIYCLKLEAVNKEGFSKAFEYLYSFDISLLSSATEISVVITSQIFYSAQRNSDFKTVSTFAEVFHKFLPGLSQNKNLKCIRMSVNVDTLPSISKVFDSREDLKKTNTAQGTDMKNKKIVLQATHGQTGDSQPREHRTSARTYTMDSRSSRQPLLDNSLTAVGSEFESPGGTPADVDTDCPICYDEKPSCLLHCCNIMICDSCFNKVQFCPFCRTVFKILTGNQPDGEMRVNYFQYKHAAGYEHCGVWEIQYILMSGIQKENHPNPGKCYSSILRTAYLPDTSEGFDVLLLLKLSFMRRLTFTIGLSLTMNLEDKITWNDIHHKTALDGGSYGYPDPSYLKRVLQELKGKGVTFESVITKEKCALDNFINDMKSLKKQHLTYPRHL